LFVDVFRFPRNLLVLILLPTFCICLFGISISYFVFSTENTNNLIIEKRKPEEEAADNLTKKTKFDSTTKNNEYRTQDSR
jgi:hypothetical protein